MENKHNQAVTIFLIVVICLLIAGLGVMTYFVINLNNKVLELSSNTNNQNTVEQNTNTNNKLDVPKEENNQSNETKKEETTSNNARVFLKPSMCLNATMSDSTKIIKHAKRDGMYAYLNDINKVKFRCSAEIANKFRTDSIDKEISVDIEFGDKKVVDIYILSMQMMTDGRDNTLFFLMEDGTVEFMPIRYAIIKNKFESYGKLEGIKDVVKIAEYGLSEGIGGVGAILAVTDNGNFYSLVSLLGRTGYYNSIIE